MKRAFVLVAAMVVTLTMLTAVGGEAAAKEPMTLAERLVSLDAELTQNGEVGWAFNNWKQEFKEAMRLGENYLFGTKQYQAVQAMTIGKYGNFEENYEEMKKNKFLQALAKGDEYDYGIAGVTYLAKAYKKQDGMVGAGGYFRETKNETSWSIYNSEILARRLGVTVGLIDAWNEALSAYTPEQVYY